MSAALLEKIQTLKKQRNAVILAHNYQPGEIQDMADYTGDSLGLSVQAAQTDADVIVFCGVLFMAETAAILSPEKTVLLPEKHAGCPMADMINAQQLQELKGQHPDALVVCYVNSTAEVKALSDYCCTSGNALKLTQTLPDDRGIIFVPDKNLGSFIIERTGREMILWPGYCPTHTWILPEHVAAARKEHPEAKVLAHPECNPDVRAVSDELLSTGQMLKFAETSNVNEFIIATENGIIHTLQKQNPDKLFFPATEKAICPNMKKISLEKVAWAMEDMQYRVTVPEPICTDAKRSLDRMLQVIPK
ncbi:MAG: quinolinate synthase [Planctomycetales bacterium 4572_13]|nr:MAG: quinolinate synthase [Planctomycetales bacterium 4572_13]